MTKRNALRLPSPMCGKLSAIVLPFNFPTTTSSTISNINNKIVNATDFCQYGIDGSPLSKPLCKSQVFSNKYHFSQDESIDNGEAIEMVFYAIFCRYDRFM